MKFVQPKNANYYDLVRIPHGHIPAPMIKFWSWLPIPIKGQRDWNTFHCPVCGGASFFKVKAYCEDCASFFYEDEGKTWIAWKEKDAKRWKWKRFEHAILPLLALFGKAWYMPSERLTHTEQVKKYGPPVFQPPWSDDWEIEMKHRPLGKKCDLCGCELNEYDSFIQQDHPKCCEEHGDFLDLCESCSNWYFYSFGGGQGDCVREAFYGTQKEEVHLVATTQEETET